MNMCNESKNFLINLFKLINYLKKLRNNKTNKDINIIKENNKINNEYVMYLTNSLINFI
jgi:hypothetical protein